MTCAHEFQPIDSSGQRACLWCNQRESLTSKQWCDVHGVIPEHAVCACDYENIGRAFMESIARNLPDYSWSECPSEVIVDLINQRDDARASVPPSPSLTPQERHALWNCVEAARDGFAWTDPTGRKLLKELYERTAVTKPEVYYCVPCMRDVPNEHKEICPHRTAVETVVTPCPRCKGVRYIVGVGQIAHQCPMCNAVSEPESL